MKRGIQKKERSRKSTALCTIEDASEERHKALPSFEWHGPLENYYKDGSCTYIKELIKVTCKTTGSSVVLSGTGGDEKVVKFAMLKLSNKCQCGGFHKVSE